MAGLAMISAVLASAAAVQAQPPAQELVPFELFNGRIYLSAFVNERGPYRFALDTGASGEGRADSRLVAELGLRQVDEAENSDGVAVTTTDVVQVESLRLGPITKRNVQLLARDYNRRLKPGDQRMMGIIARDFFADRLVTVDYPGRTVRFAEGALDPKEPGVVRYGPSFAIPVCFGEVCHAGKVDTGSNRGLVLPKDLAANVATGAPRPIGEASRTNSSVGLYEISLSGPVRVGALSANVATALYAEPSTDTINIGGDFLKDYVLTIDSRNQLLRIASKPGLDD